MRIALSSYSIEWVAPILLITIRSRDRCAALDKTQDQHTGHSEKTKGEIGVEEKGEHCGLFVYTLRAKPEKVSPLAQSLHDEPLRAGPIGPRNPHDKNTCRPS